MMEQKITVMEDKITLMEPDKVQVIPESIESLLEGRSKLNYSVRSYTVNELQGGTNNVFSIRRLQESSLHKISY